MMRINYLFFTAAIFFTTASSAQVSDTARRTQNRPAGAKPEDTEFYTPVPPVITPGANYGSAPSDAIVLFDGKDLNEWTDTKDTTGNAKWIVANNAMTVNKSTGDIQTK